MRSSPRWIKIDTLLREGTEESKRFIITWKKNMPSVEYLCLRTLTQQTSTIASLKIGRSLIGSKPSQRILTSWCWSSEQANARESKSITMRNSLRPSSLRSLNRVETQPKRQRNFAREGKMEVMASIKTFKSAGSLIIIKTLTHLSQIMSLTLRTTREPPRREEAPQLNSMQKKKTTWSIVITEDIIF
jgi:hypothetical protein